MKNQNNESKLDQLQNDNAFTPLTENEEKNVLGGISCGITGGLTTKWDCKATTLHGSHNAVPGSGYVATGWALAYNGGSTPMCVWTGDSSGHSIE